MKMRKLFLNLINTGTVTASGLHNTLKDNNTGAISVMDTKLFFSDPGPIFFWNLYPDLDPTWLAKSSGSGSGSDPKYSRFYIAINFTVIFMAF
jgi:hypothetical protein